MAQLSTLPVATLEKVYTVESKFSAVLSRGCEDLTLPLKFNDTLIVVSGSLHYQSSVDMFIKFQGEHYCPFKRKTDNFYILVRRGVIDYKISVKDFRLELLKMKGVLK